MKGGVDVQERNRKNLIGKKYGRWTVIDKAPDQITPKGYHNVMWKCRCECGTIKIVRGKSLVHGISKSRGCYAKEVMSVAAAKHHCVGTRLYNVWDSMRQRCLNPNSREYSVYGGRGISVCKEWDDFTSFRDWAIKTGYDANAKFGKCTLDRIDCNKEYSPANCRWVDMKTQSNNKRNSIWLRYNGEYMPLTQWADVVGLDYSTPWKRYRLGKTPEQILHK